MRAHLALLAVILCFEAGWAQKPPVRVVPDSKVNGWNVRVRYGFAPDRSDIQGHAWTLDHAKEVADAIAEKQVLFPEHLRVNEIQLLGKEGNGQVEADERPRLPGILAVEQRLRRAETTLSEEQLNKKTKDISDFYRELEKELQDKKEPEKKDAETPEKNTKKKALKLLQEKHNKMIDDLEKAFPENEKIQLPRFRLPEPQTVLEHVSSWQEGKRMQYQWEQLRSDYKKQRSDLQQFTQQVFGNADEVPGKELDPKDYPGKYGSVREMNQRIRQMQTTEQALAELKSEMDPLLTAYEQSLLYQKPEPPTARFSRGEVKYLNIPEAQVWKADSQGMPLPADQQPPGYPRSQLDQAAAAQGETLAINPNLQVQLLSTVGSSATVSSGVYGQVKSINAEKGEIRLQIDDQGTELIYSGIKPFQRLEQGQFVSPSYQLGTTVSKENRFQIAAQDSRQRLLHPVKAIEYARRPPSEASKLKRKGEPLQAKVLSEKPTTGVSKDGAAPNVIVFNEAASKVNTKLHSLKAKLIVAQGELQRATQQAEKAVTDAGEYPGKLEQVDQELKAVQERLQKIETDSEPILRVAQELAKRKQEFNEQTSALTQKKTVLEALANRVRSSNNQREIEDYNKQATEHNEKEEKLRKNIADYLRQESKFRERITSMQQERTRSQEKLKQLEAEKKSLEMKTAQSASVIETAKAEVTRKQDALKSVQKEMDEFKAKEAEAATTTGSKSK